MSNYDQFAQLYDELTLDVNYKVRSDYISDFFKANGINQGTILDLACGTGSISEYLIQMGYRIIGIDLSENMLCVASQKLLKHSSNFSLLNGKMQDFELPEPVDGCVCSLDSINHLENADDVLLTFKNVYNSLKDNGIFVFDVNTIYKHQNVLGDNAFVFDEEDYFLAWDNELIDDTTVRILLDFFVYNGESYDRYSEEIIENSYSVEKLTDMLNETGFRDIQIYDELTKNPAKKDSERLYFVCKKG